MHLPAFKGNGEYAVYDIEPLPKRCREGQWEVLINSPDEWLKVKSESQAENIALSRPLADAVDNGELSGPDIAKTLEAAADALDDLYGGVSSIAERKCRRMAKKARDE